MEKIKKIFLTEKVGGQKKVGCFLKPGLDLEHAG